jgi:hypothetical protein
LASWLASLIPLCCSISHCAIMSSPSWRDNMVSGSVL